MQITQSAESGHQTVPVDTLDSASEASQPSQWHNFSIIRRNGAVVGFEPGKIAIAMTKAFLAVNGGQGAASARVRELVATFQARAANSLARHRHSGGTLHMATTQEPVELAP